MKELDYQQYLDGTAKVLAENARANTHRIGFRGKKLIVRPGVFSPKFFHDSRFFVDNLPIEKGQTFFEIGPGSGIVSVDAALRGASKVVAIDSNADAVRNTEENALRYGVADKVNAHHGSLFTVYDEGELDERFDSIFWNVPFGFVPKDKPLTQLEEAVFSPEYRDIKKFIERAPEHLNRDGLLHIGFSSTLGISPLLQRILSKNGFDYKIIARKKSREVHPVSFELYEAKLKDRFSTYYSF